MEVDLNHSFDEETPFNKHRIICGDRTFFVNGDFLRKESPYFEKLFFGDFKETATKVATIGPESNISEQDVFAYLSVLYGRQEVTMDSALCLIRLGDLWDTPSLKTKCGEFLESCYGSHVPFDGQYLEQSIDILEASLLYGLRNSVANLVEFIGRHSLKMLKDTSFLDRVEDTRVVATVFAAASFSSNHSWVLMSRNSGRLCHCGKLAVYYCAEPACYHYCCATHRVKLLCRGAKIGKTMLFGEDRIK